MANFPQRERKADEVKCLMKKSYSSVNNPWELPTSISIRVSNRLSSRLCLNFKYLNQHLFMQQLLLFPKVNFWMPNSLRVINMGVYQYWHINNLIPFVTPKGSYQPILWQMLSYFYEASTQQDRAYLQKIMICVKNSKFILATNRDLIMLSWDR